MRAAVLALAALLLATGLRSAAASAPAHAAEPGDRAALVARDFMSPF